MHDLQRRLLCLTLAAVLMLGNIATVFAQETGEETLPAEQAEQTTEPAAAEVPEIPVETMSLEEMEAAEAAEVLGGWAEEPWEEPVEEPVEDAAERVMPQYFQSDYPDIRYASGTIETNGCGIVSLAMVASYLTGYDYTPELLADWFGGHPGSNIDRVEYASTQLKLPWRKAINWHYAVEALKNGSVVIVLMNSRSIFTDGQHFVVAYGLTDEGRVLVNDPFAPNYEKWDMKQGFEKGFVQSALTTGYDGAWIYDVNAMPDDPYIYEPDEKPSPDPRYPDIHLTLEEEDLLAKVVWVEARGESAKGQQAVAEVVFNRLKSGHYGETLSNVIYGEGQFRSVPFLEDAEPTQTQYDAIKRAYRGPYVLDEGVVHFARAKTNDRVWGKIGGHIFCYE